MGYTVTQVHDVLRNYRTILTKKRPEPVQKESPKESPKETHGIDQVDISREAIGKLKALKDTRDVVPDQDTVNSRKPREIKDII
jgi:hypothetical protein